MIHSISIANPTATLNNVAPQKKDVAEPKTELLYGRKVIVKANQKALWISRIVCALIIAAGIALIAALTTAAAITGGVSLIAAGVIFLIFSNLYLYGRAYGIEKAEKKFFSDGLKCREDFSDLKRVQWTETSKTVKIKLTKTQMGEVEKGLQDSADKLYTLSGDCKNIKDLPFLLCFEKDKGSFNVAVFDSKLKKKDFSVEIEGETGKKEIALKEDIFK